MGDLLFGPLLHGDPRAVGGRRVDGRLRHRDQERDPGLAGGEREAVGADLVGHVPVGRDPVRPDHHRVHLALADQERGGRVGDQVVLDAELAELPAGEPGPLQQRAGLVHHDVPHRVVVVQRPDDAERGAPAQAREAAGVAVGPDPQRCGPAGLPQEAGSAFTHPVGRGHDRGHRGQRRLLHRGGPVRDDRRGRLGLAAQVDGGGPGVGDPLDRRRQAGLIPVLFPRLAGGEGDAEGARDAEHRRAADGQPGDRVHQLADRGEMKHADLVRERRLVDGDDVPVAPAEDLHSGPGVGGAGTHCAGVHWAGIHTVTLPEEGAGDAAR